MSLLPCDEQVLALVREHEARTPAVRLQLQRSVDQPRVAG